MLQPKILILDKESEKKGKKKEDTDKSLLACKSEVDGANIQWHFELMVSNHSYNLEIKA